MCVKVCAGDCYQAGACVGVYIFLCGINLNINGINPASIFSLYFYIFVLYIYIYIYIYIYS